MLLFLGPTFYIIIQNYNWYVLLDLVYNILSSAIGGNFPNINMILQHKSNLNNSVYFPTISVCGMIACDNKATLYINGEEVITAHIVPSQEFCHSSTSRDGIQAISIRCIYWGLIS